MKKVIWLVSTSWGTVDNVRQGHLVYKMSCSIWFSNHLSWRERIALLRLWWSHFTNLGAYWNFACWLQARSWSPQVLNFGVFARIHCGSELKQPFLFVDRYDRFCVAGIGRIQRFGFANSLLVVVATSTGILDVSTLLNICKGGLGQQSRFLVFAWVRAAKGSLNSGV